MRQLITLGVFSALLTACTGDNTDSSSSTHVSGPAVSSSSNISSANSISSINNPLSSSRDSVSSSVAMSSVVDSSTSSMPSISSITPISSSTSSITPSSISTLSSSSTAATQSSSESSAASSEAAIVGNAEVGKGLYLAQCHTCHGDEGKDVASGGDALFSLNANNFTLTTLIDRIDRTMPPKPGFDPENCVDQCAADIAAYINTWASAAAFVCEDPDAITYTPRTLRVLTVDEYKATLEDLLTLPTDYKHNIIGDDIKGGFPNNGAANVDQNSVNKFWNNAWEVAAWAVANDKPASCGSDGGCASPFVEDFLPRLFRRPLTQEEIKAYFDLFNEYEGDEGLEMAMATALTAPQFLYRSEMGIRVGDILDGKGFDPVLGLANTVSMPLDGPTRSIGLYQSFGRDADYDFTGDDVIKLRVKGEFGEGHWPTLTLKVGNQEVLKQELSSASTRVLNIPVKDITGRQRIEVRNDRPDDVGHAQFRAITVSEITLGNAIMVTPPKPDEDKLKKADPDAYILDGYEYATALSYITTGSTPDDALMAAAEKGELEDASEVLKQINRLIDTPRGMQRIGDIVAYWFGTDRVMQSSADRDNTLFPTYTPVVREAMATEVRELFKEIFFSNRPFKTFYSGDFTLINSTLSDYYGIPSESTGADDWRLVDNLEKRGGMLTSGAFMSLHAHPEESAPILRAAHLRRDVLCQHLDSPPVLEDDRERLLAFAKSEDEKGTLTTAGFYNIITDSPACKSCHKEILNPLFGMEDFGPTGLWRTTEKGSTGMNLPIDPAGKLFGPIDINDLSTSIDFSGAKELSKVVADLPGIEACLVDKTFRYIAGMPINDNAVDPVNEDTLTNNQKRDFSCAQNKAMAVLERENQSPRALYVELIMQDLIRFRAAK